MKFEFFFFQQIHKQSIYTVHSFIEASLFYSNSLVLASEEVWDYTRKGTIGIRESKGNKTNQYKQSTWSIFVIVP